MPSAERRPVIRADCQLSKRRPAQFPTSNWKRGCNGIEHDGFNDLRQVGLLLNHDNPHRKRNIDARLLDGTLRPLPRVHPWAPYELAVFDTHVRFITDAPNGLVKSVDFDVASDEQKKPFAAANAARMEQLEESYGADAVYIFTDASRVEQQRASEERCAGAFVVCYGADPYVEKSRIHQASVPVSPIACIYSGELSAIEAALSYVYKHRDAIFAGGKNRNIVLVSDSKSSLETVRTTWLQRIGYLEQDVARRLYDLAICGLRTTLAFVFSHVGGAPGNDYVDKRAQLACKNVGSKWTRSLWHADTTRRVLRNRHEQVDREVGRRDDGELAFRFRSLPEGVGLRPSEQLPRGMTRQHEVLVYKARLGMVTAAGGLRFDHSDCECPMCRQEKLGRNGATLTHLVDCLPEYTEPSIDLSIDELWTDPCEAARRLELATKVVKDTPLGRERAEIMMMRRTRRIQ